VLVSLTQRQCLDPGRSSRARYVSECGSCSAVRGGHIGGNPDRRSVTDPRTRRCGDMGCDCDGDGGSGAALAAVITEGYRPRSIFVKWSLNYGPDNLVYDFCPALYGPDGGCNVLRTKLRRGPADVVEA